MVDGITICEDWMFVQFLVGIVHTTPVCPECLSSSASELITLWISAIINSINIIDIMDSLSLKVPVA